MKTQRNILIAFLLNLSFSIFEFIGGALTGSVAIASDAIHDLGDAMSIGLAYLLERKSKEKPDENYTYGYARYSILGSFITTMILIFGSVFVIYSAIKRLFYPEVINYNGMIIFAIFGVIVNVVAAYVTRDTSSLNQRAVNLHMLEDVLGWIVVLIGSIVMKFTDFSAIDSILSLLVASYILYNAIGNLDSVLNLFLEKSPDDIKIGEIKSHLLGLDGVKDVHHIHFWSLDGNNHFITMHVVTCVEGDIIKEKIREELKELGICHATLELELPGEKCEHDECELEFEADTHHHHHHHHGHSHTH